MQRISKVRNVECVTIKKNANMKKCIYLLAIMMMAILNQSCEPVGMSNVIDKENQDNVLRDTITPPNNPMDEKPIEPDSSQNHTVLINLAELGDSLNAIAANAAEVSIAEIEAIMARRGYVKFHENKDNDADYYQGDLVFSIGVPIDSTWFGNDMTAEISQLQENACVLAITYYKDGSSPMLFEVEAAYILPVSPEKDYLTLSKDLYDYYAATHPFQVGTNNQEVAQCYTWWGDVVTDSEDLSFNDFDVLFAAALQAGVMSQEEYEVELSMARADGWHKDFLQQIEQPYLEVGEQIEALHAENGWNVAGFELENDYSLFFDCQGIRVVEGYWYGYENAPAAPMTIQKRTKRERTNNDRNFIHKLL